MTLAQTSAPLLITQKKAMRNSRFLVKRQRKVAPRMDENSVPGYHLAGRKDVLKLRVAVCLILADVSAKAFLYLQAAAVALRRASLH